MTPVQPFNRLISVLTALNAAHEVLCDQALAQQAALLSHDAAGLQAATAHLQDAITEVQTLEEERQACVAEAARLCRLEEPVGLRRLVEAAPAVLQPELAAAGETLARQLSRLTAVQAANRQLLEQAMAVNRFVLRLWTDAQTGGVYGAAADTRLATTRVNRRV